MCVFVWLVWEVLKKGYTEASVFTGTHLSAPYDISSLGHTIMEPASQNRDQKILVSGVTLYINLANTKLLARAQVIKMGINNHY